MAQLCPPFVVSNGVTCNRNSHVIESNFAGLFKTEICVYQCEDRKTFVLRWQHRFLWFRSETQQRHLRHLE